MQAIPEEDTKKKREREKKEEEKGRKARVGSRRVCLQAVELESVSLSLGQYRRRDVMRL